MGYKEKFLEDILEINEVLKNENPIKSTTLDKISNYLTEIKEIGPFSLNEWKMEWRMGIYKFGELFKEKNPSEIFKITDNLIESSREDEVEVLDFIKSEIYINFFPTKDSIKYLLYLASKHKLNPEFKNTINICYKEIGKEKKACDFLKQALKLDPKNENWLDSIYKSEYKIAQDLITSKKHKEADAYITKIIDSKFYKKNISDEFQNFFKAKKQ